MGSACRRRDGRHPTDWIALEKIVHPIEERPIGPFRLQGLFVGRQPEAAAEIAETTSDEIVTIANVAGNHMHGTRADRTRTMIRNARRPAVDGAAGPAEPTVRLATGTEAYESRRDGVANESVSRTIPPRLPVESVAGRRTLPEVTAA